MIGSRIGPRILPDSIEEEGAIRSQYLVVRHKNNLQNSKVFIQLLQAT